ncbi:MAG TPA: FMN-binding negative transcriptional regulator [Rhizomicrobium sp.]|jgi:transcriptional regulator|nr:FMN-binding negative transcriptional regulator [Rhizomicrobium sp.]
MYRPKVNVVDDIAVLHGIMRERSFATIAAIVKGRLHFAYAPMAIDTEPGARGALRFHLARGNPIAELDDAEVRLGFLGPDAYVSPDWYETKGSVPTWNYIAVEGAGRLHRLDESGLRRLLVDLSSTQEEKLRPKIPWTLDKIGEERITALLRGIRGFTVALETLEGKFKLSQDKAPGNIAGVIAGLEARGDAGSLAVAGAMKEDWRPAVRASTGSA